MKIAHQKHSSPESISKQPTKKTPRTTHKSKILKRIHIQLSDKTEKPSQLKYKFMSRQLHKHLPCFTYHQSKYYFVRQRHNYTEDFEDGSIRQQRQSS